MIVFQRSLEEKIGKRYFMKSQSGEKSEGGRKGVWTTLKKALETENRKTETTVGNLIPYMGSKPRM